MKVRKKLLVSFISVLCFGLFAPSITSCDKGTEGLEYVLSNIEKSYTVIAYHGTETNVVIPSKYKSKPVVSIWDYAFTNCSSLKTIVIPDSVTRIEWGAFDNCSSLTTVYYTGTEEQWDDIFIYSDNEFLTNATIVYNYVPEEE